VKIVVLGNAIREGVAQEVDRLLPRLRECCDILAVDLSQQQDLCACPDAEMAVVFGGDGAILRAARQMGYRQLPVLGVNIGHLGFLADLDPARLLHCLPDVMARRFHITRHLMFECVVGNLDAASTTPPNTYLGLNEAAFHTLPPFPILDLDLQIDGEPAARFRGDGLILSTPIGATAHSLSAGGPILGQELSAFVITPICPHTLTQRPVVESADKTYTIAIAGRTDRAALVIDGQELIELTRADQVLVRKAPVTFGLVKVPGNSFYRTLQEKLHWGTLPRYRREL
jgi:NAD+ kinase